MKSFVMKRMVAICMIAGLLFAACKKSSSDSGGTTTVEYQVLTTNSSGISITYNNVLGNKVQVNAQNNFTFDVTVDTKPFDAYIQATSTSPFSSVTTSCTVNIVVNGSVAKTATVSSNTAAVAQAEYTVQ